MHTYMRLCACVCLCVCVCARAHVYMYMIVVVFTPETVLKRPNSIMTPCRWRDPEIPDNLAPHYPGALSSPSPVRGRTSPAPSAVPGGGSGERGLKLTKGRVYPPQYHYQHTSRGGGLMLSDSGGRVRQAGGRVQERDRFAGGLVGRSSRKQLVKLSDERHGFVTYNGRVNQTLSSKKHFSEMSNKFSTDTLRWPFSVGGVSPASHLDEGGRRARKGSLTL